MTSPSPIAAYGSGDGSSLAQTTGAGVVNIDQHLEFGFFWLAVSMGRSQIGPLAFLVRSEASQAHQGSKITILQPLQRNILAAGWQPMLRRSVKCCMGLPHRSQVISGSSGNSVASVTGAKCQSHGHSTEQI